jgi:GR25 family glycosyltransferase involved in LPS biosynthesis
MKIFIIHYKKLIDRKKHILKQFEKYNITDYEFIEIDRDELQGYDLSIFENITNAYMAVALSHLYAYKQIKDNYDEALILEDDVILADNFINIFNNYLIQLPQEYDMLFLGDGCYYHIDAHILSPNKNIYQKSHTPTIWGSMQDGSTRCIDSCLVSKKCAIKLCNYINNLTKKINTTTDHWLNIVAKEKNFLMYWAEPTITTQGSQTGMFERCYIQHF